MNNLKQLLTNISKRTSVLLAAATLVASSSLIGMSVNAQSSGSASVTFSPSSGSYENGSSFDVNVNINTGSESTATAQVIVNYDASKLQLTNLVSASEPYETQFGSSTPSGSVDVTRASLNGDVSGSNRFMRLRFRATATGSATISIGSGSAVLRASDSSQIWDGSTNATSFTITAPATPAPTPPPSTPTSPSPATPNPTSPTPTTPSNPTPASPSDPGTENQPGDNNENTENPVEQNPPADDVIEEEPEVAERKFRKAIIKLRTKVPVRAKILFGVDGQLDSATAESELSRTPQIELDPALIVPGRTYSYKVVLTDEAGNTTETQTKTFRATGYKLKILLKNKEGAPLKRVQVVLRSEPREGTTNDNGEISFEDVELGDHTLSYTVDGKDYEQTLAVIDNVSTNEAGEEVIPEQVVEVVADLNGGIDTGMLYGITGATALLAAIGAVIYMIRKRQPLFSGYASNSNQPSPETTAEEKPETLLEMEARVRENEDTHNPEEVISPEKKEGN